MEQATASLSLRQIIRKELIGMPIPNALKPILKLTIPVLVIGALAGILGAVASGTYLIRYSASLQQSDTSNTQFSGTKPRPLPGSVDEALGNVRRSVAPALVLFYPPSADGTFTAGQEKGVGVVVTSDGWIATTTDVFTSASVGLVSARIGDTLYAIDTIDFDPLSSLVMAHVSNASGLPVVPFGDSEGMQGGEAVYAVVGDDAIVPTAVVNPRQVISSTSITAAETFTSNMALADQIILPSGIVANSSGEFVALTLAKTEGSVGGVGALPIHQMLSAIKTIIRNGEMSRAYLGASVHPSRLGTEISSITLGSPAITAGLQKGDVVERVSDVSVSDTESLADVLARFNPGDRVTIVVNRTGVEMTFEVELGKR